MVRALSIFVVIGVGCVGRIGDAPEQTSSEHPTMRPPESVVDPSALAPLVRRLTRDEYVNTIEDLLSVTLSAEQVAAIPVDRPLQGFVNIASGQTVLPDHVLAYSQLADEIAATAEMDVFIAAHTSCRDVSCRDELVARAGETLFRRPLADDEVLAFVTLFDRVDALDAGGVSFEESAVAVVRAMLQSPQFLYLLAPERGDGSIREIVGFEMASRLSYALWAAPPDAELLRAARAGELDEAAGVAAQLARMLEDTDRVRRVAERFLLDWARLDSIPDDDGLRADLVDTATAYYASRVLDGDDLFDLFVDDRVVLTAALAERYGVDTDSVGDAIAEYDVSDLDGRGGLLAQPGVVAGMTNADGGEIVARGLFLMTQLFCGDAPDPPASLQAEIDAFVADLPANASTRDVAEVRLTRPECAACHASFDPLAYGFEQLDYRGGFRLQDEVGNALRVDGWIPESMSDDGDAISYATYDDYMILLADSERVRRCLTQHQIEYVLGRKVGTQTRAGVAEISDAVAAAGGGHRALLEAIVTHDLFRTIEVAP